MSDGGKGSKPRPYSVSEDQFAQNWDTIFGKKDKTPTNKHDEAGENARPENSRSKD